MHSGQHAHDVRVGMANAEAFSPPRDRMLGRTEPASGSRQGWPGCGCHQAGVYCCANAIYSIIELTQFLCKWTLVMTHGMHILVAEDEHLVAMTLAEVLGNAGFRVTITCNGRDAVDADANDPADLLVTDMRMPILGGSDVIQAMRDRRPNLPVIVLTGYSERLPKEEPSRLVVLPKPFSMSTLVRQAEALLRSRDSQCT